MNSRQRRRNRITKKQLELEKELTHRASFGIVLKFTNEFHDSFDLFRSEEYTKERIIDEMQRSINNLRKEVKGCKTIKDVCDMVEKENIKFTELDI